MLEVKRCPCCEDAHLRACFPEDIRAYVQYGDSVTVLAGLLSTYGAVSLERIHGILGSLLGVSLSPGTISAMVSRCVEKVGPVLGDSHELLKQNDVNHFDETGVRVNGHLYWVHNSSSANFTYQTINEKRGRDGIDHNGVISKYSGVAVHDCWGPDTPRPFMQYAVRIFSGN